jgi:ABC-type nitrate/sulfonate/bicarbonate transport system permease component
MKPRAWLESIGVLACVVGLWWLATELAWVSRVFLPSPQRTWQALSQGLMQGELAGYTVATVIRMVLGWGLACVAGVVLGVLIGTSAAARDVLQPMFEFMRPLPASAVIPLAISLVGLSNQMVMGVIAFGAMWPVLLGTMHGIASVHPRLHEVAAALELPRWEAIRKIGLPNAMPDILAGMRLSLTVSLIVTVVGEILASQSGLGQAIILAARSFRADELFAGIVLLGAVGFVSNLLLALAERRLLRYQRR